MRVLVTGGTGFVGAALLRALVRVEGSTVRAAVRQDARDLPQEVEQVRVGSLSDTRDWSRAVEGVDSVVHLAARVHVMRDDASDPLSEYRRTNVEGTLGLARHAAAAGIRRFVFASSVKVNGEETEPGRPFTETDDPAPTDPYGISKLEAEKGLFDVAHATGMQVVCVRPPLIYGPGVKANFLAMAKWLQRGIPLPLGAIHENRRSLIALDNLVDLLATCIVHPAAAGQVFLASDGEDLSTAELLCRTAIALGRRARLVAVPRSVLAVSATILGKRSVYQRLCGSLQVDSSKAQRVLAWSPLISVNEGLARAVAPLKRVRM